MAKKKTTAENSKRLDKLNQKIDDIQKSIKQFEKTTDKKIKDNPKQSVMIAFGVGALAGAVISGLMGRRR